MAIDGGVTDALTVTMQDAGVAQAIAALGQLADPELFHAALADMGEELLNRTQERFEAEQDPDGKAWEPLARSTLKQKRIKKILTESSNLRNRIVYKQRDDTLEIGTNVIYAGIHQFGGRIERGAHSRLLRFRRTRSGVWRFARKRWAQIESWHEVKEYAAEIPARPFLGVGAADAVELVAIIDDHMRGMVEGF